MHTLDSEDYYVSPVLLPVFWHVQIQIWSVTVYVDVCLSEVYASAGVPWIASVFFEADFFGECQCIVCKNKRGIIVI